MIRVKMPFKNKITVLWTLILTLLLHTTCSAPSTGIKPLPKECVLVNSTFVDCRHCDLRSVPKGIPVTVETLLLSQNSINRLTNESFHGLVHLVTLELHHNSISKLKAEYFKDQGNLRHLILHHNQLGKLPDDTFAHTPNLEVLDLSFMNHGFQKLPVAVRGLTQLLVLNFASNRLQSASFEPDIRFPSLRTLRLGHNQLTSLQIGDFSALQNANLSTLDLTGNHITDVANGVFQPLRSVDQLDLSSGLSPDAIPALANALSNVQLQILYLRDIGLTSWSSENFKGLQNSPMKTLDISDNDLTALDSSFPGLTTISTLVVRKNKIAEISETAFSGLDKIEILDLSGNSLTSISDGMFSSLSGAPLTALYLNASKIKSIDAAGPFKGLHLLKYLKLSNNYISQNFKGSEFSGLQTLEVLDLGLNSNISLSSVAFKDLSTLQTLYLNRVDMKNITSRPSPFKSLSALNKVDLSNNNMALIDVATFSNLAQLETLYLQHNNLYNMWNETTHVRFLNSLRKLKYLDLCFNGFQNIPNNTFNDTPRLETLLLCQNKISHFQDNVFDGLNLRALDLGHNQINLINRTMLEPVLGTLQTLSVSGNPFSCGCELRWFRDWLDTTNVHIQDLNKCVCESPPPMRGDLLTSFHPETLNCDHDLPLYAWCLTAAAITFILLSSVLMVKYRWYITYYYHLVNARRKKYKRLEGEDRQFKYDAFISFCQKDYDWIGQELIPNLERDDGFRLCIHNRDFLLGKKITDSIVEAVHNSRYTLCLLSSNYLKSRWCKMEREFAMANLIHRDVLIIILLEEIPEEKMTQYYKLHKVMMKRTYLQWPRQEGKMRDDFWVKLKTVLRDPDLRVNNNDQI